MSINIIARFTVPRNNRINCNDFFQHSLHPIVRGSLTRRDSCKDLASSGSPKPERSGATLVLGNNSLPAAIRRAATRGVHRPWWNRRNGDGGKNIRGA